MPQKRDGQHTSGRSRDEVDRVEQPELPGVGFENGGDHNTAEKEGHEECAEEQNGIGGRVERVADHEPGRCGAVAVPPRRLADRRELREHRLPARRPGGAHGRGQRHDHTEDEDGGFHPDHATAGLGECSGRNREEVTGRDGIGQTAPMSPTGDGTSELVFVSYNRQWLPSGLIL